MKFVRNCTHEKGPAMHTDADQPCGLARANKKPGRAKEPVVNTAMEALPNLEAQEEEAILRAILILRTRFKQRDVFGSPDAVKDYLRLEAQGLAHEVFAVLYLDSQNRLIEYARMFRGTLTQTSVYPREVVRHALAVNAAAVILHHNHPSGVCEPSRSDEALTQTLKAALALVDVRVLDHVITSDDGALSMAERGLL
jgi:DNA repair protein RadC